MNTELDLTTASLSSGLTIACYILYKVIAKGHCRSRCCRYEMLSFDISTRSAEGSEPDLEALETLLEK